MKLLPSCLLYTEDPIVERTVTALLHSICTVRRIESAERLDLLLQQSKRGLVVVDVRAPESLELISQVTNHWKELIIIALGEARSDPILQAQSMGVYTTEDLNPDRIRFQNEVGRALDHLNLIKENSVLRAENYKPSAQPFGGAGERNANASSPFSFFANSFRSFQDLDTLLRNIVEGVVRSTMVSRAGIFTKSRKTGTFTLQANIKCLEETLTMEFGQRDPFIKWLEIHAHMISPATLEHIRDPNERMLLDQALETFGAEIVIPLHARGQMAGWLFMGHRITGVPFDFSDLEDIIIVAEHISTTLENAMLYEEVALQKSLADTLFHSLPVAIVAVSPSLKVEWVNTAAQKILGIEESKLENQQAEILGSFLCSLFRQCLSGKDTGQPHVWQDSRSKRTLSAELKQLTGDKNNQGAVALIQDLTRERRLREKQDQVDRAQFWNELAASMSHEIRNPLVAIKTFSQLLPERHQEEDFRKDFSKIVTSEVDRLNQIVDQINNFANPPEIQFHLMDLERAFTKAINLAKFRTSQEDAAILMAMDENLPMILADESALVECLSHLLVNAIEACANVDDPKITLGARMIQTPAFQSADKRSEEDSGPEDYPTAHPDPDHPFVTAVPISVEDNGQGIPAEDFEKSFSPFYTTKAKGMGLGLPIVKRTVIDHNGDIRIDSLRKGTRVSITLPQEEMAVTP
jgi:nitrogen-specific signal transduction histidine kinase